MIKKGTVMHGFQVTDIHASEELHGHMIKMIHPSGAVLYYLDNGEENKVFSVTFRTIPFDNTGVFHILEHSVLCGSERFPVKEPFVELLKGSMNTFLNALTFPDKTMFPVSSRNEQDFLNLVSVYLDAVFRPNLLRNKNIFLQEGWHIETDEQDVPAYKGVVFNEMKGAMSQQSEIVRRGVRRYMYPDTGYGFNSGGEPTCIPDLTYERCIETYQKYYHPANSIFYLEGSVPLETTLEFIDQYLSSCTAHSQQVRIDLQEPKSGEFTQYYELPQGMQKENRGLLSYGRILGNWKERVRIMAADIICDVLAGTNEAPLTRAILEKHLAQDVILSVNASRAQFDVTCTFENITDGKEQEILDLLHETVKAVYEAGLDKKEILASINQMEFAERQVSEPQGIGRAVQMMNSVLYGGDPLLFLENDAAFEELRSMTEANGFEEVLYSMFLDERPSVIVHTLPSLTLGQELREQEKRSLDERIASWSEREKIEQLKTIRKLKEWQSRQDSTEALRTIPHLHLRDIGDMPHPVETILHEYKGCRILYHPLSMDGVTDLAIYISLNDFSLDELKSISLWAQLAGMLPTLDHDARTLQREIRTWIGSFSMSVIAYAQNHETERCNSCLLIQADFLEKNREIVMNLIYEVLTHTVLEPSKMKELLVQMREGMRQSLVSQAHSYAKHAVFSYYGSAGAVNEALRGITMWKFVSAFPDHFDAYRGEMEKVICKLKNALCRERMILSEAYDTYLDYSGFLDQFPDGNSAPDYAEYCTELPKKIGYCIPGQSSCAVMGYNFSDKIPYTGSMAVAAHFLTYTALWNEIRVRGGAYGSGISIRSNRNMLVYSYRDPTPGRSLEAFAHLSEKLMEDIPDEELEKTIIACISEAEPLSAPQEKAASADMRYLTGRTLEEIRQKREEVIHTTLDDLHRVIPVLEEMHKNGAVCVVGHEDVIRQCTDLDIQSVAY